MPVAPWIKDGFHCMVLTAGIAMCCVHCRSSDQEEADAAPQYYGPFPIAVDPEIGTEDVFVDKVIRVTFSDHLSGRSIDQDRFDLHSGSLRKWVAAFYDPVHSQLVVWPSSAMRMQAMWILALEEGLKGLDGESVAPGEVTSFRTGKEAGDNTPFVPRSFTGEVLPIFQARCSESCHNGADQSIADLRLDAAQGIQSTAINVRATGWPAWKRIVPSRPGESYLLYKIIGDRRISGQPMPRSWDQDNPAPPLSLSEKEAILDWIASGTSFLTLF